MGPMRQLSALCLILPLLGGGCSLKADEAAARVVVTYTFKAGCITVIARDAEDPGRETRDQVEVLTQGPSEVRFAVFRKEDWSRTLEITTTAHEQSCEGPVVDEEVRTIELRKGEIEPVDITLEAPDEDDDGYMPLTSGGTDCADEDGTSHPGVAEVCDTRDNDCDESTDEGVLLSWYPDADSDTFGDKEASPRLGCTEPSGTTRYVLNNTDCRDSDAAIAPRASPSNETRCDEEDDDCDGVVDDGFELKNTPCSDPCSGQYVCNGARTALVCNGPTPASYHPAADGVGTGDESSPFLVCPGAMPPAGYLTNGEDCDDQDPKNEGGGTEVCDGRDNTCDGQRDENNACMGKGWVPRTDGALTGIRDWRTVALSNNGARVWMAGLGGVLAVRLSAGQGFTSLDGACGGINWRAAWVRPSDGQVFLAGDGGNLAQHTGSNCTNQAQVGSGNHLTSLIGFESQGTTLLYVVDHLGRLYTWTPGSAPQEHYNSNRTYFGIHGLPSTQLLVVGGLDATPTGPRISSYPGTGGIDAVVRHTLNNVPAGYEGTLRAVWMGGPELAYAVGDDGLVMKWDGTAIWERVSPPGDTPTADFTSVGMLDAHSIYVTDTGGRIRLRTAARWLDPPLYDADRAILDIAVHSPSNIWAVGSDGLVLHFAE